MGVSDRGGMFTSPALGNNGLIYVAGEDGYLYALDWATGQQRWATMVWHSGWSSPAIGADGTVYIGSRGGGLYAVDGTTGVLVWQFAKGGSDSSPVIGVDGTVYVGGGDSRMYAIESGVWVG